MTFDRRTKTALWMFVAIVLGFPILYWALFWIADRSGISISRDVAGVIRSFSPALAAVVAISYACGRGALRKFGASIIQWRVSGSLYAIALLAPVVTMGLALLITWFVHPEAFSPGDFSPLKLVAILVILPLLDGPLGEEPGWRGYFLPTLLQKYSFINASLIVGVVWYLWHLPFYYVDGRIPDLHFLYNYLFYTFALSFMHTWLNRRTGGSVLLHIIFHNMTNYVVLLGFTVFPAIKTITLDNTLYMYFMFGLGGLAALALWQQDRARPQRRELAPH